MRMSKISLVTAESENIIFITVMFWIENLNFLPIGLISGLFYSKTR